MRKALMYLVAILIPTSLLLLSLSWLGLRTTNRYNDDFDLEFIGDRPIVIDPDIGFIRRTNAQTRQIRPEAGIDYTIYTDNIGARVNSASFDTPDEVTIVTIGGSFSEGHGFRNEDTYTERLGRTFEVSVANFSLGSYGGVQSLLTLRKHKGLHPRFIIYGMIDDHGRRNLSPCAPSYLPFCIEVPIIDFFDSGEPFMEKFDRIAEHDGLQASLDLIYLRKNPSYFGETMWGLNTAFAEAAGTIRFMASQQAPTEAERLASAVFVVEQMHSVAIELDAKLIVLYMPAMDGARATAVSEAFSSRLPPDVALVDATDAVTQFYENNKVGRLFLTDADPHPNARAHGLFADILGETVMNENALPSR